MKNKNDYSISYSSRSLFVIKCRVNKIRKALIPLLLLAYCSVYVEAKSCILPTSTTVSGEASHINQHPTSDGNSYNILNYGAVADTSYLSTAAIQRTVDDCARNGGGTVYVPAGSYNSGTILLKSHVNLHLAAGAIIYASRKKTDYNHFAPSIGASDKAKLEALVAAVDAINISVTGMGTLHCQGVREGYRREPKTDFSPDYVTGREIDNAIKYGVDYQNKFRRVSPSPGAINFNRCTHVQIKDIKVVESAFWGVHIQHSQRIFVEGIYITSNSDNGVNSDGLDIDGCQDVMISNCRIDTGDDALCLKTTRQDSFTMPCRNITIINCVIRSSSAALKLGTESHANFENITVTNCVIDGANRGLNMIIRDGGVVRNVLFDNIVIHTERKQIFWWGNGDPIWFLIEKRGDIHSPGGIEDVVLSNIIAYGESGIRMEGIHEKIKNIRMHGVQLFMQPESAVDKRARNGYLFHNIDGLQLSDCNITWDCERPEPAWESAFYFKGVKGLLLDRVIGPKAPGSTFDAFRFEDTEIVTAPAKGYAEAY